jgi:hypothetical protein
MANPMKIVKAVKKVTAGKAKVNKNVRIFNQGVEDRTGGTFGHVYKKGKMIEVNNNYPPIKVKPRNIGKLTKQMLPSKKKETKSINKIIKKQGKAIKPNVMGNPRSAPKVPVKKRGN